MSESAIIEQEAPAEAPPQTPEAAQASRFGKWTDFIDLGEGAQDCPDHGADCAEPGHFHAWVRLPNGLVHRDIRERALAGQARRTRLLHDPDSDAGVVLENEIEELRAGGLKAAVVDALIERDFPQDYTKAVAEVQQREEFQHIVQDQAEFERLTLLPEDERPADEFDHLRRHLEGYTDALKRERANLIEPKRQALEARDLDDLLVEYRAHRVDQEAAEVYLHVFGTWELIACTYKPEVDAAIGRPGKKMWKDLSDLQEADGDHIDAARAKFDELRANQQRAVMGGNS